MPRLKTINPETAQGKAKLLLDGVQKSLGMTPNIMRMLANSPAALEAYLGLMKSLSGANIDAKTRESIALVTSAANGCDYCASAHTAIGKMVGLSDEETRASLRGQSSEPTRAAALQFAQAIVEKRGWVNDQDLERVRESGLGDAEITEIVATIAMTMFSNYFNHVAQTDIDFPIVKVGETRAEKTSNEGEYNDDI